MKNALTVDVEDYYHVSAFAKVLSRKDWPLQESRVEHNTQKLLDLFDDCGHKATFFVLGLVAERYPSLVREIVCRGHEIASHGFSHELIYKQSPEVFRQETLKSKKILEDCCQHPVIGYRAASYSIVEQSLWALDILQELDFEYDSSIFPVRHDRYGIPGCERAPHTIHLEKGSIVEFPLTTLNVFGYQLPMAGGGYFRLYPFWFTRKAFSWINRKKSFIFYLHPWEIDPGQPLIEASWLSRFRHYNNLDKCESRLRSLLSEFQFSTVKDVLVNDYSLLDAA